MGLVWIVFVAIFSFFASICAGIALLFVVLFQRAPAVKTRRKKEPEFVPPSAQFLSQVTDEVVERVPPDPGVVEYGKDPTVRSVSLFSLVFSLSLFFFSSVKNRPLIKAILSRQGIDPSV